MQNRKYKYHNKSTNYKVPEIEEITLRDFDIENDIEWFTSQLLSDLKMSQQTPHLSWILEFIQPNTIESIQMQPIETIQQIFAEHLKRSSSPQVITSNNKTIGLVFLCKIQAGVILIEKFYINYVLLMYKQQTKVAKMLINEIKSSEERKAKLKGHYSKLKKILWIFRENLDSFEYYLWKELEFRFIKNQSRVSSYKMYRLNINNLLVDDRLELIMKQFSIFNKNAPRKKKTAVRDDLKDKIMEMKEHHSPLKQKTHQSTEQSKEKITNFINIQEQQDHSSGDKSMLKNPSLPNLKSLRSNIALNNQSLVSSQSSQSIGFQNQLFKQWHFKPSIQEQFKIALNVHKDKFDLLQKEKEKLNKEIAYDSSQQSLSYLSQKSILPYTAQSTMKINNRTIIDQSPNFDTLFKSNLRKIPDMVAPKYHSHKPSYETYISKNGADFHSETRYQQQSNENSAEKQLQNHN